MFKWEKIKSKKIDGILESIFYNNSLYKYIKVVNDKVVGFTQENLYVFTVFEISGDVNVVISDLKYFKENECSSDWHLTNYIVLPDYLMEEYEGFFTSTKSVEETKANLLKMGFIENYKFKKFIHEDHNLE